MTRSYKNGGEVLKGTVVREGRELATQYMADEVYQVRTVGEISGFGITRG